MPAGADRIQEKLGRTIRKLREEASLSQATLAEKAGLQPNYVGEVERGEKLASIETVVRIAQGLGITGERLLAHAKL